MQRLSAGQEAEPAQVTAIPTPAVSANPILPTNTAVAKVTPKAKSGQGAMPSKKP
jgi:hypothetical protein